MIATLLLLVSRALAGGALTVVGTAPPPGIAAAGLRRRFMGCDLERAHLETAVRRLGEVGTVEAPQTDARPQPQLFAEMA